MDLNVGNFSTNPKRCVNESALETCHNIEGTMLNYFHAREERNYRIIYIGCSNHMAGDKSNFVKLQKYDGGLIMFGDDTSTKIYGKGLIIVDGNHKIDDVIYLKGF